MSDSKTVNESARRSTDAFELVIVPVALTVLRVIGKMRVPPMVARGPICFDLEHMAMPAPSGVPSHTSFSGGAHSGLHRPEEAPP